MSLFRREFRLPRPSAKIPLRARRDYPHFLRTKKYVNPTLYWESRQWDFDFGMWQGRHAVLSRNIKQGGFSTASGRTRRLDSVQGFSCLSLYVHIRVIDG